MMIRSGGIANYELRITGPLRRDSSSVIRRSQSRICGPVFVKCRSARFVLSLLMAASAGLSARAADPPPAKPPAAASNEDLKEQTIYIPYDKLRKVFEKEGRGVFLPYEQFQVLWWAAREKTAKPPDEEPPVESLITEVISEAEVVADVVKVTSHVRIEVLTEGWHEIPLRLSDAAITSAKLADQPARIVTDSRGGYRLLHEKTGSAPQELELTLEYAKAFTKSPGRNSVSFEALQAPVSRWRVRIPEAGVNVNIHPLIAATEVPAAEATEGQADETVLLAFVGAAPRVQIDWTPRAEGATGLSALVAVDSVQRVWVQEGVVRSRATLTYDISRAPLERIVLQVPADQRVIGVVDANVRQWSVTAEGDIQTVTLDLFEPAQGRQTVGMELERFTGDLASATGEEIEVPVIQAVGAGRQQGVVGIAVAEDLRVDVVRRSGLMQIDATEMARVSSSSHGAAEWDLSYRYTAIPFGLALRVEKVKPRITLDTLVEAVFEPEELTLHVQAVYDIHKTGVFRLELNVPSEYTIRGGRGLASSDVRPVAIESYKAAIAPDGSTQLLINLREKALGRVGFAIDLHKQLEEPDLLGPSGTPAELSISFPRIAPEAVEQATGRFVLYAPESIRVNPSKTIGLLSVPWSDALAGMASCVRRAGLETLKSDSTSGVFSYAFAEDPFELTFKAKRRKPYVTARQLLTVGVESGVVKYTATFFYDIRYSGIDSLRIDVPTDLATIIQNQTSGVSDSALDSPPDDVSDGYTAFSFRADKMFKGQAAIALTWETELGSLNIGKSVTVSIPRLVPQGVDRAWGQIVLAKAETIDVRPVDGEEPAGLMGLRPIDPRHDLMEGIDSAPMYPDIAGRVENAARAFEFHDEWRLVVTATRYQLEEVKQTSISRAFIRMVVTRSGQVSAQAIYRMRSARQRLTITLPKGVEFDSDPVRINDRSVPLERGQEEEFVVPLVGQASNTPFLLDIRYTIPSGGLRFACPAFGAGAAAQKAYLGVYLPPEWELLGSIGPWTDDLHWRFEGLSGLTPHPRRRDGDLITWVTQDVTRTRNPRETFQTDGRFYLFSTLRPLPPPDGILTLVAVNKDLLGGFAFAIVVILGLTLLRGGSAIRFYAVGAFLTVLILLGVFLPTFSRQILGGVLASALLVVAILWLVEYLAWRRPRDPDVIARKEARQRLRADLAPVSAALSRGTAALSQGTAVPTAQAPTAPLAPSDSDQHAGQPHESSGDSQRGSTESKGGKQDE